jgi:hypothetical protein
MLPTKLEDNSLNDSGEDVKRVLLCRDSICRGRPFHF